MLFNITVDLIKVTIKRILSRICFVYYKKINDDWCQFALENISYRLLSS